MWDYTTYVKCDQTFRWSIPGWWGQDSRPVVKRTWHGPPGVIPEGQTYAELMEVQHFIGPFPKPDRVQRTFSCRSHQMISGLKPMAPAKLLQSQGWVMNSDGTCACPLDHTRDPYGQPTWAKQGPRDPAEWLAGLVRP